ncbi:MAG: cobalamin B12-binding domain-containing protein [Frankiaceae bacterium]
MDDLHDRRAHALDVVVTSSSSDAHTWNLVYLQLLLEELGHRVTNLGACVPEALLVARCAELMPDLVVLSSVNGHGWRDGAGAVRALRANEQLTTIPAVIGGKLGIDGPQGAQRRQALVAAGFDEVFEGDCDPAVFAAYLAGVRRRRVA